MSSSRPSVKQPRRRQKTANIDENRTSNNTQEGMPRSPRAQSTSLESIHIQPRTPKTSRANISGPQNWRPQDEDGIDEVELTLLGEDERLRAAQGMSLEEEQEFLAQADKKPMSPKDKRAIGLLIILCEYLSFCDESQLSDSLKI